MVLYKCCCVFVQIRPGRIQGWGQNRSLGSPSSRHFSRTARWILMKLGRDEVLMVLYKCCCVSARSARGE